MSAHIALPGIDGGQLRPGTVAPNILTGILRDSLGFKGLVVTDALNMGGVATCTEPRPGYAPSGRRRSAASAGRSQPGHQRDGGSDGRGEITSSDSTGRSGGCSSSSGSWACSPRRTVPLDSIPSVVGRAEFREEARDMAPRSVVMVKDVNGTVHGLRRTRPPLTLITYGEEDNRSLGNTSGPSSGPGAFR